MTTDVHTPLQTVNHHALVQFFAFVPFSSKLHENGKTQRVQPHVQFVLKKLEEEVKEISQVPKSKVNKQDFFQGSGIGKMEDIT